MAESKSEELPSGLREGNTLYALALLTSSLYEREKSEGSFEDFEIRLEWLDLRGLESYPASEVSLT